MADAWEDMTDIEQASALELMGGKRQANILSSLISNYDIVEDVIQTSLNSSNSALEENAKYLDSMQGRIDLLKNSMQSMWVNAMDSEVMKFLISLADQFVKVIDKVGLLNTVVAALFAKTAFSGKKFGIVNMFAQTITGAQGATKGIMLFGKALEAGTLQYSLFNAAATMGISLLAGVLISALGKWIDKVHKTADEIKQEAKEITDAYKEATDEIKDNLETLTKSSDTKLYATLEDEFKHLAAGVDKYGNNISLTSDEYERYREICEQIVGINPRIAAGYDSATRAIGNNASVLSQLIELQKAQARQNIKDLITDDNLDVIAKDAFNNLDKAKEYVKDLNAEKNNVFSSNVADGDIFGWYMQNSGWGNGNQTTYGDKKVNGTDIMEHVLHQLGIVSYDDMKPILDEYTNDLTALDRYLKKPEFRTEDFLNDYIDQIIANPSLFSNEIQQAVRKYNELIDEIGDGQQQITDAQDGLIDTLLQVPHSLEEYDNLSDPSKNFIIEWIKDSKIFKIDPNDDKQAIQQQLKDNKDLIIDVVKAFGNEEIQSALDSIANLDKSHLNVGAYSAQFNNYRKELWNAIGGDENKYGFKGVADLNSLLGFDPVTMSNQADNAIAIIDNYLDDTSNEIKRHIIANMSQEEYEAFIKIDWNLYSEDIKGMYDVYKIVRDEIGSLNDFSAKTYSALAESTGTLNDIISQTAEIVANNTEVTEEYRTALEELGFTEEELGACFDDNNRLVVKNAKLLNQLIKQKKKDQQATVREARAHNQLEYKNTVRLLKQYVATMARQYQAQGYVSDETLNTVDVLREQLKVLEDTIQKYALLELSMTDAANAYSNFESAKEQDALLTYGDSMIEMIEAINEGFKTGKTGSETFQAAVEALVPESVYKDIDDLEERLIAIHDYLDKDKKFADYFTIDDGNFSIEFKNIEAFIKDCQEVGLFTGTDPSSFELNPNFNMSDDTTEKIDTINGLLRDYQELYGGTVDLVNRNKINITHDNIDIVSDWGMDANIGDYMTVASQTYQAGNAALVVTPILPNGELMEQGELDAYINEVIAKANAGNGNYADYDTKGILMGVFGDADTWEENLEKADEFAMEIHGLHEVLNALKTPGMMTLKDFADALGVTESAALAMLTELEKYDSSWGDIITDLTTNPLDRQINNATIALEEALNAQEEFIRSGQSLNSDEYKKFCENVEKAEDDLAAATNAALQHAQTSTAVEAVYKSLTGEIALTDEQAQHLVETLGLVGANGKYTVTVDDNGSIVLTDRQLQQLRLMAEQLGYEPSILDVQLNYDETVAQIDAVQKYIDDIELSTEEQEIVATLNVNDDNAQQVLDDLTAERDIIELVYGITTTTDEEYKGIVEQLGQWETNGVTISINTNASEVQNQVDEVNNTLDGIEDENVDITANDKPFQETKTEVDETELEDKTVDVDISGADAVISKIGEIGDAVDDIPFSHTITFYADTGELDNVDIGGAGADGNFHPFGSAFAGGSVGAPRDETALVGELGPEMLVRNGRWFTVGQNGAEFTQVKRGDIIFNHKQTEDLLSKGYVTGRGKLQGGAFASGTVGNSGPAYYGVVGPYVGDEDVFEDGSDKWKAAASGLSNAADNISDAADKFEEVFDWVEVRLEEINESLDLKSAKLENEVGYKEQNKIIDNMISENKTLYNNLIAGANEYYEYSQKLLEKVPSEYREAAQNGSIAIEKFVGEVDEKTLEAIQDYREWVQKGADATQQAEETLTEISNLAKQAIDHIAEDYENMSSLHDLRVEQLEAYNSLLETDLGSESVDIYRALIAENSDTIGILQSQRDAMQAELDKQVEAGNIEKYSQNWYDAVNDIAAVDTEIIELTTDIEDYQDSINSLHWDHFDNILSRLEAISNEAENLIDLLNAKDLVDDAGNWTDEGITALGLYAQKLEVAEVQAKKYEEEISYLNENWKELGYTEQEYYEKLEELKDGQYETIKAYNDTKDAIVDLNKERVESIKKGIEKEIEAYSELIEKQKEALDSEKDLYDFQKNIAEKEKNISKIERQIAALSADNSASARAKRAKLEAELAEALEELQDTYYDRSISNQQDALDKELENFQEEKDKEMEGWDEYLEDTEKVVSDSLTTVQANTEAVYQTLLAMGAEYGLSITESLTSPWTQGEAAIQSFSEQFGIAISSTVEELEKLEQKFKATMSAIEGAGTDAVNTTKENTQSYTETKENNIESGVDARSNSSSAVGLVSSVSGNIKYGHTGSKVKKLQQALNELGYGNSGTSGLDGIFGDKTLAAVKKFQKDMGIAVDGIVGPETKQKFKIKGYAKGTNGVDRDQLALIDELGEELVIGAKNGRLTYLEKGSSVLPATLTSNLMAWGSLDPQDMLDRSRPVIGAPHVTNTETVISIEYGDILHIDNYTGERPEDLSKMIDKAFNKHMKDLNQQIRRFAR